MSKKFPALLIVGCLLWLLSQSAPLILSLVGLVTSSVSEPKSFFIGNGEALVLELPRTFLPKDYFIEFRSGLYKEDALCGGISEDLKFLDHIEVNVFRHSVAGERTLVFSEGLTVSSWSPDRLEDRFLEHVGIKNFNLSPGKYSFEIKDMNSPNNQKIKIEFFVGSKVFTKYQF